MGFDFKKEINLFGCRVVEADDEIFPEKTFLFVYVAIKNLFQNEF